MGAFSFRRLLASVAFFFRYAATAGSELAKTAAEAQKLVDNTRLAAEQKWAMAESRAKASIRTSSEGLEEAGSKFLGEYNERSE